MTRMWALTPRHAGHLGSGPCYLKPSVTLRTKLQRSWSWATTFKVSKCMHDLVEPRAAMPCTQVHRCRALRGAHARSWSCSAPCPTLCMRCAAGGMRSAEGTYAPSHQFCTWILFPWLYCTPLQKMNGLPCEGGTGSNKVQGLCEICLCHQCFKCGPHLSHILVLDRAFAQNAAAHAP